MKPREKKINCPRCQSSQIIKNGTSDNGKQKHKCKDCGRQFVINPQKQAISEEIKALVDRLLLERISLTGIARVVGVSKRWLQNYVNNKYDDIPKHIDVRQKSKGRLTLECDEMWSFAGKKSISICAVLRPALERACRAVLEQPGASVLVYGPTNVGKTTLVLRTLRAMGWDHCYTDCIRKMTPEELHAAAVEAIGAIPGERAAVWIVEDFHKLRLQTRYALVDKMRAANAHGNPRCKVVILSTSHTLLEDPADEPMLLRLSVKSMSDAEIATIIDTGADCLNVRIPSYIRDSIVFFANGQMDVVHQFAIHLCLEAGIDRTQKSTKTIGSDAYAAALCRTPQHLI